MHAHASSKAAILAYVSATVATGLAFGAEQHSHSAPEKLGTVVFETSCAPKVKVAFNRAVALLHSFAYSASEQAFRDIARLDPRCAMAHWGIALSRYHPLWAPPDAPDISEGLRAVEAAQRAHAPTPRERDLIKAVAAFYEGADRLSHADRARAYEKAMADVASRYPDDTETQIFYALALLSTAAPTDRNHAQQKSAAKILEPLYRRYPQHPGLAHYLIHAYDSTELAARGLAAARAYSKIAPSAPHALHMPSHIFTRLGLWEDSISSNAAARRAARDEGDIGEALHAMDYLTYAYLQLGRFGDAERIVREAAEETRSAAAPDFKIGYAANAMPVRLAIEQAHWSKAAALELLPGSPPQVAAIVYWARAIGKARGKHPEEAVAEVAKIEECQQQLRTAGNQYWATQTGILEKEARAWIAMARGNTDSAIALMRAAANEEDGVEKLPLTPGPIVPAREQLAEMLLLADKSADAQREFAAVLKAAPGRRNAMLGVERAKTDAMVGIDRAKTRANATRDSLGARRSKAKA